SADAGYILVVTAIPTQDEVNTIAISQRILAGARFVDRVTGRSLSLTEAQTYGAVNLAFTGNDPSTIYCDCNFDVPPTNTNVDWNCVKAAYDAYAQALSDAADNYQACTIACLVGYLACWAGAMFAVFTTIVWGAVLLVVCTAAYVAAQNACEVSYNIS